jgi:outer membrane protein assembly factor BamD (BamD/ComL family)
MRAFGVALLVGACASVFSNNAFSGPAKKGKPAAADAGAAVALPPTEPPSSGDYLNELFAADGGLAGLFATGDGGVAVARKTASPLPPPTPAQVKALQDLRVEAEVYEKDAKDFRDTITRIVRQHYEERRKRVLTGLDREIGVEKKALGEARNDAIRRLEEFVARYSAGNAQPDATPDAMFRLAALYDERAREASVGEVTEGLKPAIALYKRILREFPAYRELAGVYYYLGHALSDANRLEESQQIFRTIVCHNHYPYPVPADPKDPDKDQIGKVPQDHPEDWWTGWRHKHPTPESLAAPKKKPGEPKGPAKKGAEPPADTGEELSYRNPFPDTCTPIPQKVDIGRDPRYLAEVWWKIGDWYFDETDSKAGPYSFNRAVTTYHKSMQAAGQERGVLYGVSMYKLAWTFFKQQRYEAAVKQFIELLRYTDEREKRTGDPGADFRAEAYTYIAGSLTYVDFAGPGEGEPFIPRSDVLDLERDPRLAEQKMRVAIQRVQDNALIPQDQKWTVEIYRALMQEFREINQQRNQIEVAELVLKKWPLYRDAPMIQAGIADTYDELTRYSKEGTAEHAENAAKALAARSALAKYVGTGEWVNANREDPEALQNAERLVRGGLQRAAADHTNLGRAWLQKANETGDAAERGLALQRALQEYRLAEQGWGSYLAQDPNAPDAYESRFWLADAHYFVVFTKVAMGQSPASKDILAARQGAVDVRDSNEDDRYLEPAAYYAVNLAFVVKSDQNRIFRETNGSKGLEDRTAVKLAGQGDEKKVVKDPIPLAVRFMNLSQEEYVQRVPQALDVAKRTPMFRFNVAESYFAYGHFDEARKRFETIYNEECGKSDHGYKAWERLLTMSNLERDLDRSRQLAEAQKAKSCAVSTEQKTAESLLINPTLQEAAYVDARKAFQQAEKMKDGPERQDMWRKAAALYRSALEGAPDRQEAPEAAMNGAYSYKQVSEYDKAIAMYNLFIDRYGDDKTLNKLQNGDPKGKPPAEPNPKLYAERVKYLKQAYDALSASYVLFFNYRKAAEEYDKISNIARFEEKDRRSAAKNALMLWANMGERNKTEAMQKRFLSLGPSAEEKAEADFIVAKADLNQWDERGRDEGANREARARAQAAMGRYYDANQKNTAAAKFVVVAAYYGAKTRKAANDPGHVEWFKKTIAAYKTHEASAGKDAKGNLKARGTAEAGMAAEADFTLIDADIRKNFDYDTGHHRYQGTTVDVTKKYREDAKDAEKYHEQLKSVLEYAAPEWFAAARGRQGSLYDSLRTGLYNARPPSLKLFSEKEEKILKKFRDSDNPDDQDRADQFEQKRREVWRDTRDKELASADEVMVKRYVQAVYASRKFNVTHPWVDRSIQRLAFATDVLGDEKMRNYSKGAEPDYVYQDGMYLRARPGIVAETDPKPLPLPLPVVPQ